VEVEAAYDAPARGRSSRGAAGLPRSLRDPAAMFEELLRLRRTGIADEPGAAARQPATSALK